MNFTRCKNIKKRIVIKPKLITRIQINAVPSTREWYADYILMRLRASM